MNLKQNFIITAACFVEHSGLLPGQGYIAKDVVKFRKADGKQVRLLKMKNPWKKSENIAPNN